MVHDLFGKPVSTFPDHALVERKRDDAVAALGVDLHVAAGADDDILLAVYRGGGGRRIDAGTGLELPQDATAIRIIGLEPAIGFACEHHAAGRGQNAADHRLRRLHLTVDVDGVVVD